MGLLYGLFRANLASAAQFFSARSESRLPNDMLSLHSATVLDAFYFNFYCWCLNWLKAEALQIHLVWWRGGPSVAGFFSSKKNIFCLIHGFLCISQKCSKPCIRPEVFLAPVQRPVAGAVLRRCVAKRRPVVGHPPAPIHNAERNRIRYLIFDLRYLRFF